MYQYDVIKAIKEKTGYPQKYIKVALDAFEETLFEALVRKEEVRPFRGLVFFVKDYEDKERMNPRTGDMILCPSRSVARAKFTRSMIDRINDRIQNEKAEDK